jgi:predicted RNase H-like nuclease (RuvC/YqgF family)
MALGRPDPDDPTLPASRVQVLQETRDSSIATRLGLPRSTVAGWLRRAPRSVTTTAEGDVSLTELRAQVMRLKKRNRRLAAVLRLLFALLRILEPDLSRFRISAPDKTRLLRAIERTRRVRGLRRILAVVGLSAARLYAWRAAATACQLEDRSS